MTEEKEVDQLSVDEAELNAMLRKKEEEDLFNKKLAVLQGKVSNEKKEREHLKQEVMDAEARKLKRAGLNKGVAYIKCWQCQTELPITGLRQSVAEDGSSSWYALDAVCPVCSEKIEVLHPGNKKYGVVCSYCMIKETHHSQYYDMKY
jgi:hypothetical protein